MTADYIVRVIAALDRLTEVAISVEDRLTTRLIGRAASADDTAQGRHTTGLLCRSWLTVTNRATWLWNLVRLTRRVLVLLPKLLTQHRRLRRLSPGAERSAVVVGIASNRLILDERAATARDALVALFARVGGGPDANISEAIRRADHVLLFDALPVSALWTQSRTFGNGDLFIVDGAFLLFEMVVEAVVGRRAARFWRAARQCAAAAARLPAGAQPRSRRRTMIFGAIAETNDRILRRWTAITAFFLTCNSVLTEVLRAQLIEAASCRRIVDIMHGVGSIPAEQLFATVLDEGRSYGASDKHVFIPQIAGLPLTGVFKSHADRADSGAINSYLNMYFLRFENEGRDMTNVLDADYRAIRSRHAGTSDPMIITVLGFAPHGGRLVGSAAFEIECELLSFIGDVRDSTGANWMLMYAPHPVHADLEFDVPLFKRHNISVYRNSVLTWLISDACVSLMSSAMFEAAHFGVRAFTPTIASDEIFTADYLKLVSHPAGASLDDCREALGAFLTTHQRPAATDILKRARHRLTLMRRPRSTNNDPRSVNEQHWVGQDHRVLVS